jgi:hypothetical protein
VPQGVCVSEGLDPNERRKALLDALMPEDELRSLWLRHAAFHNAINNLARFLPFLVDRLADQAKMTVPMPWDVKSLVRLAEEIVEPEPQEAVDSEHLRDWYFQQ